ncbi:diguanylate cyclase [Clostridium sp. LIBA-8841]|uniref:sensor domain-containing diguanylate cyclase n=1 Tax=Clostridium sp. LIBA-8841 TaxID=2987530 RepID=UPI002AC39C5D|nr:diguanylate cyclase [Clostridium sp. LIBA-8841]MDZ5254092.1 diguanylate cyclase [Clostridium sp. LIBA-8841]
MDELFISLDSIDILAWVCENNNLVFVNKTFKKVLNIKNIEEIDKNCTEDVKKIFDVGLNEKSKYFKEFNINNENYSRILINVKKGVFIGMLIKNINNSYNSNKVGLFKLLIDSIPEIVFFKDIDLNYTIINEECRKFYNSRGINNIIGKTDLDFPLDREFLETCNNHDKFVLETKKPLYIDEKVPIPNSDKFAVYQTIKTPVIDKEGKVHGLLGSVRDISSQKEIEEELRRLNKELEERNKIDPLTGVYNKEYLRSIKLEYSEREKIITAIMIDIDFFKLYNDNYGHIRGDNVILQISNAIKKTLSKDLVFRYGGEEFLIISTRSKKYIINDVELLMKNIYDMNISHNYSKALDRVTISLGIATEMVKSIEDMENLIENADIKLYESKKKGRNTYSI